MLVQLQVENFRSFKTRESLVTLQRNVKRFSEHVYEHKSGLKILKTTGIYGANASGKTNLFLALQLIKKCLHDPDFLDTIEGRKFYTPYKLDREYEKKPTHIEVDFIIDDETVYVYSVDIILHEKIIIEEKLTQIEPLERIIFIRKINPQTHKQEIEYPLNQEFNANHYLTKSNSKTLFLTEHYFHEEHCKKANEWFTKKIEFLFPIYDFNDIAYIFTIKPEYLKLANDIIQISNVGIDQIGISKIPINLYFGLKDSETQRRIIEKLNDGDSNYFSFKDNEHNYCSAIQEDGAIFIIKLICYHKETNGELVPFDIDQESRGTAVLLHLIPALLRSYGEGINYFIDDINTSLHPVLLKEILGQYLSYNIGSAKGQLIFNSHEDFLMDERIIRQDELWLMEKENGASTIFPLSDFDVRFDLNYRKNYLNGKFGGVPFKSEPKQLVFGE